MFAKEMSLKFLVLFIAFLSFFEAYGASLKVVVEGIKEIKGELESQFMQMKMIGWMLRKLL